MSIRASYQALKQFVSPENRGEGWTLEHNVNGLTYSRASDKRKIVIKSYLQENDPDLPVTLELRYGADGSLGWVETPSELHYDRAGRLFRKYWYRHAVYWPHSVRRPGWMVLSLPSKEGGTGVFQNLDGRVMTLTSQNNVLPQPSPFSNCELAYFKKNQEDELIPHREGDAPAFLIYERLTREGHNDWDSIWRPVWLEWKCDGCSSRSRGPYLKKMGFRQTVALYYLPGASQNGYLQLIKTGTGRPIAKRYPEVAGQVKGIAYRESGKVESIYFSPGSDNDNLLAIHFQPNGKKRFLYSDRRESGTDVNEG